jgi:hypothetical protein
MDDLDSDDPAVLAARIGQQLLEKNVALNASNAALNDELDRCKHSLADAESEVTRLRTSLAAAERKCDDLVGAVHSMGGLQVREIAAN